MNSGELLVLGSDVPSGAPVPWDVISMAMANQGLRESKNAEEGTFKNVETRRRHLRGANDLGNKTFGYT